MESAPERRGRPVVADVGFGADPRGSGVAFVALRDGPDRKATVIRVRFRCRALPALSGRDVAYAALRAVVDELIRRRVGAPELRVADAGLALDLAARRDLSPALVVPYVALRCALNRLPGAVVVASGEGAVHDLTTRASAEACLDVAA